MKALTTTGDGAVALTDVPDPSQSPAAALVRVRATSLNRGELRVVAGGAAGLVPGWDVAGELAEDVPELDLKAGTPVAGLVEGGAWAELASVALDQLAVVPAGVATTDAAALPTAGLTALQSLQLAGSLLGRTVLITGAAGGVGRFAVQFAAAAGAHVTAVVRDDSRAAGLRELGAGETVRDLAALERRFDFILESVGGDSLTRAFGLLAPGGDLVSIGSSSNQPALYEPRSLFNGSYGARIHPYMVFEAARGRGGADLSRLLRLVADGRVDPQVERVVSWHEFEAAAQALANRTVNGKLVLTVD